MNEIDVVIIEGPVSDAPVFVVQVTCGMELNDCNLTKPPTQSCHRAAISCRESASERLSECCPGYPL